MTDTTQQQIQEILEIVRFIKDTAATKEELNNVEGRLENVEGRFDRMELKMESEFKKVREEIITHVDDFIGLHQKLDTELASLRFKYERMEQKMNTILKHLHLELDGV